MERHLALVESRTGATLPLRDKGLPNEVLAEGRFLFGPEIQRDLEEMHALMIKLETKDASAVEKIEAKFRKMMIALEPYMRMDQKMPRGL